MHMADALISPAVGVTMWAAAAGTAVYSIKRLEGEGEDSRVPLMGVMGAFVFAAQMINFTIPGTGSSGHLGGGLLLAVLLGPHAGFLSMACILLIQALFFADGGLLAFGCNVFNLGFYTCFVAYPFIYKRFVRQGCSVGKITAASLVSSVVGLQLGAFSVVLQTLLSGMTELPFGAFTLLMQPIHLAIGLVEGAVTACVVAFVWKARPELIERPRTAEAAGGKGHKRVLAVLAAAAVIIGGAFSWFASTNPDGLEWSLSRAAGTEEPEVSGGIYRTLSDIQNATAFLPDYDLKKADIEEEQNTGEDEERWPQVSGATSVAGIVGGALTLALAAATGLILSLIKKK